MTFFSDENFETDPAQEALDELDAPESTVEEMVEDDEEDEELEDLGEDVERRLEVAGLYKTLLQGGLFQESTPSAKMVEKRIRSFVKAELKALIGLGEPMRLAQAPDFSPDEIEALRAIAAKVLGKGPLPPALRPRPIPAPVQVAPKTAPKPAPKPTSKKPQPKPTAKMTDKTPKKTQDKVLAQAQTENGEVVREVRKGGRLIRQYYDSKGTLVKENDITPQVKPKGGHPFPSTPQALAAVMEQQAIASVNYNAENDVTLNLLAKATGGR